MKHLKMLGLLVMAAAALMAFASSASANPILTGPKGEEYTSTLSASLEGSALLKAGIEDTCTASTATGTVSTNNTTHAKGTLSGLTFTNCTQHTTVEKAGSLTINDKGEVFSENSRVKVQITGIASCWYGAETGAVKIGTLTFGHPATMDISTTTLQRQPPSDTFWCASTGTWTGNYKITTPSGLTLT
jgi:hypothetical protein